MSALCDNIPSGWKRPCNTTLQHTVDHLGRLHFTCPRCEAVKRGKCWECALPRNRKAKKSILCQKCFDARRAAAKRKYEGGEKGKAAFARYRSKPQYKALQRASAKRSYQRQKARILQLVRSKPPATEERIQKT